MSDLATCCPTMSIRCLLICVFSFHEAEHVLNEFRETFIDVMDANAVALDLLDYNIIDSGDEKRLATTSNQRQQNQFLHLSLKQKCTVEAFKTVCDLLIKVKGNPRMRALGEDMRQRLETGVCVCMRAWHACVRVCACMCACVHMLVIYMEHHYSPRAE